MSLIGLSIDKSKQLTKEDESLFILLPYDSELQFRMAKVKTITPRRYDPQTKTWEVPADKLQLVLTMFTHNELKLDKSVLALMGKDSNQPGQPEIKSFDNYKDYLKELKQSRPFYFKTKPESYQIEAFNIGMVRPKLLIADEQGLGKTKETIDIMEAARIAKGYRKGIVVAKASLKFNWADEIDKHGRSKYIVVDSYRPEKRAMQIMSFMTNPDIYYMIIGYEGVKGDLCDETTRINSYTKKPEKVYTLKKEFDTRIDFVVADEPTKIKNPTAQVTKAFQSLIKVKRPEGLHFLTGTPIKKRVVDSWVMLNLLGVEHRTFWEFKQYFCHMDGYGNIVGTKNLDELHSMLKSVMIRRTKDLLDLPDKKVIDVLVRMGDAQSKIYNAIRNKILAELENTKVSSIHPLAILTRLRQVTTCPALIESEAKSIKEDTILEMVEEMDDNDQKVIIYSIYKQETLRLKELLKEYNPAYIDGMVKPFQRQEQVRKFQNDDKCRLLIGTLDACKEGFTLTAATNVIFTDLSWSYTDNLQAEDRAHRKGQTKMVNIYRLVCKDTVDHRVLEILEEDASLIEEVVEGKGKKAVSKELVKRLLS